MTPNGNTNVTIGLAWGWHALTSNAPLSEAVAPAPDIDKVLIILTDGDEYRVVEELEQHQGHQRGGDRLANSLGLHQHQGRQYQDLRGARHRRECVAAPELRHQSRPCTSTCRARASSTPCSPRSRRTSPICASRSDARRHRLIIRYRIRSNLEANFTTLALVETILENSHGLIQPVISRSCVVVLHRALLCFHAHDLRVAAQIPTFDQMAANHGDRQLGRIDCAADVSALPLGEARQRSPHLCALARAHHGGRRRRRRLTAAPTMFAASSRPPPTPPASAPSQKLPRPWRPRRRCPPTAPIRRA